MCLVWEAAREVKPRRRHGEPARNDTERMARRVNAMRRGVRYAILRALEEWKDGYAYSRQLVGPVSLLIEKPVTEKKIGQLLTQHLVDGRVTRVYGENAYLWKARD